MKPKEWKRLDAEQRRIVETHLSECPVRLGRLAGALGIKVKVSGLRTWISGQIRNEDGGYVIRVNRYEARERQRFTIAHALGHFLLHKDLIDTLPDGIRDNVLYRSDAPEHTEFEVNRLAMEIVMPTHQVQDALQKDFNGKATREAIESLAERFRVSKAAMEVRLENLSSEVTESQATT